MKRFVLALVATLALGSPATWTQTPVGPLSPKVGGETSPDGTVEIAADLPARLHLKNIGGSDGAGLCVFTSLSHSALWQGIAVLCDFRDWMHKYPGGGYPQKVSAKIKQICAERGVAEPSYIQVQGADIEILKLACKSGRMPGVTYSYSPTGRYGGQGIDHMVSLVYCDDRWAAVLDNNYPGSYEWMPTATFRQVYTRRGGGWAVIFLAPMPPAPPHN